MRRVAEYFFFKAPAGAARCPTSVVKMVIAAQRMGHVAWVVYAMRATNAVLMGALRPVQNAAMTALTVLTALNVVLVVVRPPEHSAVLVASGVRAGMNV